MVTIDEVLEALKEYEEFKDDNMIVLSVYSDGSGRVHASDFDDAFFHFDNLEHAIKQLKGSGVGWEIAQCGSGCHTAVVHKSYDLCLLIAPNQPVAMRNIFAERVLGILNKEFSGLFRLPLGTKVQDEDGDIGFITVDDGSPLGSLPYRLARDSSDEDCSCWVDGETVKVCHDDVAVRMAIFNKILEHNIDVSRLGSLKSGHSWFNN